VANVRVPDVRRADRFDQLCNADQSRPPVRRQFGQLGVDRRSPSTDRSHRSSWFKLARRPPVGRIDVSSRWDQRLAPRGASVSARRAAERRPQGLPQGSARRAIHRYYRFIIVITFYFPMHSGRGIIGG
jgi:hypothetical protein